MMLALDISLIEALYLGLTLQNKYFLQLLLILILLSCESIGNHRRVRILQLGALLIQRDGMAQLTVCFCFHYSEHMS